MMNILLEGSYSTACWTKLMMYPLYLLPSTTGLNTWPLNNSWVCVCPRMQGFIFSCHHCPGRGLVTWLRPRQWAHTQRRAVMLETLKKHHIRVFFFTLLPKMMPEIENLGQNICLNSLNSMEIIPDLRRSVYCNPQISHLRHLRSFRKENGCYFPYLTLPTEDVTDPSTLPP